MASTAPLSRDSAEAVPAAADSTDPPVARSTLKRLVDIAGALVLGLIALPLGLLIALAIRLDSPGSPLFRQQRVGLRGRRFTMLKFRSMGTGCDDSPHRQYVKGLVSGEDERTHDGVYKLVEDPRVTRVGRWLRRTSLDELPQLWNILVGDMSLVGPRPPLPYEVEEYDEVQRGRLACRPGLTGLWQVSGRNELSYRAMVELDLEYIRTWTPGLDLRILVRTVPVVLWNAGKAS